MLEKPQKLLFMSIITCLFLALMPYSASITFNFTKFTINDFSELNLSGDAASSPDIKGGIQVTIGKNSTRAGWSGLAGRATYITPLHLWDRHTTDLTSFSTSFTFVLDSHGDPNHGDGLTFFLAEDNTVINGGETIGLPFNYEKNMSIHPFVAVVFDSYGYNTGDPTDPDTKNFIGDHVGININSMASVMYRKWFSNITHGKECRAFIEYHSSSKILTVSFTSIKDNSLIWETGLNYTIDLREVLPEWVIFGFSASTGGVFEENIVRSWTFNSSEVKVDENIGLPPNFILNNNTQTNSQPPTTSLNTMKERSKTWLIVGSTGGTLGLVTVLTTLAYLLRRGKHNGNNLDEHGSVVEMNNEFEVETAIPRRFTFLELSHSTAGFAETEKLGEGGFGGVYKGFLKDLSFYVAIKRISNTSNQGIKEYASEVKIISRLRHRNLVKLIGWCHEKRELLLIYEFLENGSLDLHLFKGKSLLAWNTRYKIVQGLASALIYLHEEWEQCVLHRDIKSSNVMLDSNFNAKLGDFGLAKLVDHEKGVDTTIVAGTIGYMAPEYVLNGKASKESDVFSFGIVLLEIACGRRPIDPRVEVRKTKLEEWVWDLYGNGTLLEAADPCLGANFTEEEMKRLMTVGLWCAHPDLKLRPSMKHVIQVLNSETSIPVLPPKMPDIAYYEPPHFSLYVTSFSSNTNKRSSELLPSSNTA